MGPDIEAMLAEQSSLELAGRWVSGPADLMTVLGRERDELSHSDVLAWLLTPFRPHGFGDALIRRLSSIVWPDEPLPQGPVTVERERQDAIGGTRADLLVWIGSALVVIENKVFAVEGREQCERLYRSWVGAAPDVRFVLLSRTGAPPVTASSDEAAQAWRSLSYRRLAELADELDSHRPPSDPLAAATVRQYLETLRRYVVL